MKNNFAIFILTHGRAKNISTISAMKRCKYNGKYYLIVDNEDDQIEEYKKIYGEKVIVFDKKKTSEWTDAGDNKDERTAILWARNESFYIAEKLGLSHFMMLDDDYTNIWLRYAEGDKCLHKRPDLNKAIEIAIKLLDTTNALSVAFSQGGDWIGGIQSPRANNPILRKCMNSFICRTDRKFKFAGRMNEDVSTYVRMGNLGKLMMTITPIMIVQKMTQSLGGGMTDMYKETGTYVKSFYSVMYCPSCVKIYHIGVSNIRIHHRVHWNNAVAKIINEKYKKI